MPIPPEIQTLMTQLSYEMGEAFCQKYEKRIREDREANAHKQQAKQ